MRQETLFSGFKKCLVGGCTEITEKGRALEESRVVPEMFCSFLSECIELKCLEVGFCYPLLQALYIYCCDYSNHTQYRQPQNLFILV